MAAAVLMVAVAAYAAYTQREAAKDEQKMMEYQAKLAEREGGLAESQARREADAHRKAVRRLIGTQRAKLAASGVDIGSGSPLELFAQTAYDGEMDAQDIIYAGKISKNTMSLRAEMSRFRGRVAMVQGQRQAIGTLASGTAGAMGSYRGGATQPQGQWGGNEGGGSIFIQGRS